MVVLHHDNFWVGTYFGLYFYLVGHNVFDLVLLLYELPTDMYTRILIWSLLFLSFFEGNIYAQPPNPPAGWEYVRALDSLTIDEFHAVGDTIFMFGYDNHVSVKRSFKVVSYDGGMSWDSVVIPPEITEIYQYGVFPTEAKIWLSHIIDEKRRFYISKDGKNYEWFEIGKDTTAGLGFSNFFIDPKDPNHWIVIGSFKLGLSKNSRLSQSFDAGRNWKVVNVPTAPAEQLTFELVFDARRKGVWYVRVTAEPHIGQGTVLIERTTNNGETFEEAKQWGTHYGIGYPGEVRRWWGYSERSFYGPMIGNESDDVVDSINLLQKFHSQLPTTNPSNGYERWLSNPAKQFTSNYLFHPSNYIVFQSDPQVGTIVEQEIQKDSFTNKEEYTHSWIHQTNDDWKTWNTVWESGPYEYADQTFLDQKRLTLWTVTRFLSDTALPGYIGDRYKSYLYKYSLTVSAVQPIENSPTVQLKVYPNPLDQKTTLTFESCTSGLMYMEVVSSMGVSVLREEIPDVDGLQQYAADLSALPAGAYHIRLVCPADGWSAGTNVIKTGAALTP